jgi:dynein heavy chain, axonemal
MGIRKALASSGSLYSQVLELMDELKQAQEIGEQINTEERMFGWAATKYGGLAKLIQILEPYYTLWLTTFEFYDKSTKCMNQPFKTIDAEEMDEIVNEMYRKIFKLTKIFSGVSAGVAEQAAPSRVATEVCRLSSCPLLKQIDTGSSHCFDIFTSTHMFNAVQCKEKITAFQEYLPLMTAVCNHGMRDRHWDVIAEETGIEVSGESTATLKYLLDSDIMDSLPRVIEISDVASREWSIEKVLSKMFEDWAPLELGLSPWKDSGVNDAKLGSMMLLILLLRLNVLQCSLQMLSLQVAAGSYILKGGPIDEAQMLLDDHLVKVQAMMASPYAKPFEAELIPWEKKLTRLQDILDSCMLRFTRFQMYTACSARCETLWLMIALHSGLKCQSKWIYLQPIFGSDEIMKQIPKEGEAFRQTNAIWHAAMENTKRHPALMTVADMPNLLENFQQARF